MNITSEVEPYLLLISVFSIGENAEKANTIQPPPSCVFFSSKFSELSDLHVFSQIQMFLMMEELTCLKW